MCKIATVGCALALLCCSFSSVDGVFYEIFLTSFEAIPQEIDDFVDYGTIRLTRQGKNQLGVSGSFYVFQNVGKESQIHWSVFKNDFAGQKRKVLDGSGTLCQIMSQDDSIYTQLMETSNLPPKESCPFPKGNYTIQNYVIDENKFPPAAPAGEWLMEALIIRDGKIGAGFRTGFTTK